ncbi:MAG TPA: hypothetical protein VMJ10_19925, partial [Kofleriaceae bacterium]|nr:hypothetical protein [Kofleriaceae bacterium]
NVPRQETRPVRRAGLFLVATACGRIGFDPTPDADSPATPALVQQQGQTTYDMPLLSIVLPAPARVGDLLVMCGASYDVDLTGVSGGGTWVEAVHDGGTDNVDIWYTTVTTATTTIVVDGTGTTRSLWGQVSEWSGVAGSVDTTHTASGSSTLDVAIGIATTTAGRELAYACVVDATGSTFGTPSPGAWTALGGLGDGNISQLEWYTISSGPSSYTIAVPHSGNYWDAATATFIAEP